MGSLNGIQMEFANLTGTPFFQPTSLIKREGDRRQTITYKTVGIDVEKSIRRVSMKVYQSQIGGLRLIDEDGEYVLNKNFWND